MKPGVLSSKPVFGCLQHPADGWTLTQVLPPDANTDGLGRVEVSSALSGCAKLFLAPRRPIFGGGQSQKLGFSHVSTVAVVALFPWSQPSPRLCGHVGHQEGEASVFSVLKVSRPNHNVRQLMRKREVMHPSSELSSTREGVHMDPCWLSLPSMKMSGHFWRGSGWLLHEWQFSHSPLIWGFRSPEGNICLERPQKTPRPFSTKTVCSHLFEDHLVQAGKASTQVL